MVQLRTIVIRLVMASSELCITRHHNPPHIPHLEENFGCILSHGIIRIDIRENTIFLIKIQF